MFPTQNGSVIGVPSAQPVIKFTKNASISSSYEHTINDKTKIITVYSASQATLVRWGTTAASNATDGASFVIPANTSCTFYVPNEVLKAANKHINFIEMAASATLYITEQ